MTSVICLSLLMSLHHPLPHQEDFTFQAFYVTIGRTALFLVKGSVCWEGSRLCKQGPLRETPEILPVKVNKSLFPASKLAA